MPINPYFNPVWYKNPSQGRGATGVRPLSTGVVRNVTPSEIPLGGFLFLSGWQATTRGLRKTQPFAPSAYLPAQQSGSPFYPTEIQSIQADTMNDGSPALLYVTPTEVLRQQLKTTGSSNDRLFWKDAFTLGVSLSGLALTITGTVTLNSVAYTPAWDTTFLVHDGDLIYFDSTHYGVVASIAGNVLNFVSNTHLPANGSYSTFTIDRRFTLDQAYVSTDNGILWITAPGYPIGKRVNNSTPANSTIQSVSLIVSATSYSYYPVGSTLWTFSGKTGIFFRSWVWLGNITEPDGVHPQRVRWSDPVNQFTNWNNVNSFLDLPAAQGPIVRMLNNGEQLFVYCSNSIFYGYETSLPLAPIAFRKMTTGDVGLVGLWAIVQAVNTHFFVGQNNIYVLNGTDIQPIGTPILVDTILRCAHLEEVRVVHDPVHQCVLFGFPLGATKAITTIWVFDYIAKSWSSFSASATFLGAATLSFDPTWSEAFSGGLLWSDLSPTALWSDYASSQFDVIIDDITQSLGGTVLLQAQDGAVDASGTVLLAETGDMDEGSPTTMKEYYRLELYIDDQYGNPPPRTVAIVVQVRVSVDQGNSFLYVGDVIIPVGQRLGYVNFLLRGKTVRFRLQTSSVVASYYLMEYTYDLKAIATMQRIPE